MSLILAVDPGGVTGVAGYKPPLVGCEMLPESPFWSWEYEGYEKAAEAVWTFAQEAAVVVCEGFVIRANTHKLDSGAFSLTTDLVGLCRFAAYHHGAEFVRQTPAQAKGFATDDKLKALGWYSASPGGHRNDAARHLLAYFARIQYAPVLDQLC